MKLLVLLAVFFIPAFGPAQDIVTNRPTDIGSLVFAISTAPQVEILALDPVLPEKTERPLTPARVFCGYRVLRSAVLEDPKEAYALGEALGKAIDAGKSSAMCFSPRHGLRIKSGDREIHLLVCFECRAVQVRGFSGLSYASIDPAPAKNVWESVFGRLSAKK